MPELLKKLKKANAPVAVHYKAGGTFCVGYVKETDDEFVCMQFLSSSGKFDGWHCIRIEEIHKIDFGSAYLFNVEKVYRYYNETPTELKISAKNVLQSFIDLAVKHKWLCTLEIGFETIDTISGYIRSRDWNSIEVQLINENGEEDGFTAFDLEEVVYVGAGSEYEEYLKVLSSLNGKTEPPKKQPKKNTDGEGVLSFPGK